MSELKKYWLKRVCVDKHGTLIEEDVGVEEEDEEESVHDDVDINDRMILVQEEDEDDEDEDEEMMENQTPVATTMPYPQIGLQDNMSALPNGFVQHHQQADWTGQPNANYTWNAMMFANAGYNY
jgi:hypothetical protein